MHTSTHMHTRHAHTHTHARTHTHAYTHTRTHTTHTHTPTHTEDELTACLLAMACFIHTSSIAKRALSFIKDSPSPLQLSLPSSTGRLIAPSSSSFPSSAVANKLRTSSLPLLAHFWCCCCSLSEVHSPSAMGEARWGYFGRLNFGILNLIIRKGGDSRSLQNLSADIKIPHLHGLLPKQWFDYPK